MPGLKCRAALVLLPLLIASPLIAATVHVPGDAPTIAAAFEVVAAGDTVQLACGNYEEWHLIVPAGICLRSASGSPDCVTIDGQGQQNILIVSYMVNAPMIIEGIRFVNGDDQGSGGALLCNSEVRLTLRDCVFDGNSTHWAGSGGAVSIDRTPFEIIGCRFLDNSAIRYGGALSVHDCDGSVSESVFAGNFSQELGGAIAIVGGTLEVQNCTFSENVADEAGGAFALVGGAIHVERSIFYRDAPDFASCSTHGCEVTLSCSLVWEDGSETAMDRGDNLYGVDPEFCGVPGSHNYLLQSDSPCAPGNHPDGADCGLIGALPVGCETTATHDSHWGAIKVLYDP